MEETYAQALLNLEKEGKSPSTLVDSLVSHLKEAGRMKLLPGILRALKTNALRAHALQPTLEVASEAEKAAAEKEVAALGITPVKVTVNHALIRGWRAKSAGTLVDHSAKRMLTDIYQNVVAPN